MIEVYYRRVREDLCFFLLFFFFFQLHKFQIHTTRKLQYAYYDNAEYTIMWISRCNNARCVSFDAYLSYACASDMRRSGVHCNHFWIPTRSIGRDTGFKQSSYIRPPLSHYFFFFFFFPMSTRVPSLELSQTKSIRTLEKPKTFQVFWIPLQRMKFDKKKLKDAIIRSTRICWICCLRAILDSLKNDLNF